MRKTIFVCYFLLLIPALGQNAQPQDTARAQAAATASDQPVHYYHLDFVVQELDAAGKPVNSRSYTTTVSTAPHGSTSIRTGSKIPIAVASSGGNTQFQYQDIGVNIDVRDAHEMDRQLAFNITAVLSSVAPAYDPNLHEPIIRENRWQALVLIPIGKPVVVFRSDSADSKGATQLTVTATPIP